MRRISTIALSYYVIFIVFFLVRVSDGFTFYNLNDPFINTPRIDPVMWLINYTDLASTVSSYGWVYDVTMLLLPLYIVYRIYQRQNIRLWTLVFVVLYGAYIALLYTYPILSIRKYLGFLIVPIAFIPKSPWWSWRLVEVIRYYVLFIFVSAGLWKIFRGSAFHVEQLSNVVMSQHYGHMIHQRVFDQTLNLYHTLIQNVNLSYFFWIVAVLLQLLFGIGFFTRKYDKLLFYLMLLFIISDYVIMKIGFWEFLVFLPFFYLPKKLPV